MDLILAFVLGFCVADTGIQACPPACPPGGCELRRAVPGLPRVYYAPGAAVKVEVKARQAAAAIAVTEKVGREPWRWGIIRRLWSKIRNR